MRTWIIGASCLAVGLVAGAWAQHAARNQGAADGRRQRLVLKQELKEKVDGKDAQVVMVELTFAPGSSSPKHRHAGPVFGYVIEGTLEFQIEGQPLKTLRPGETFYEPAGVVHAVSRNPSKDKPAKFLAALLTAKGAKPLTTYLKE